MTQIDGFNTEVDAHPEAKVEDVISGADVLEDAPNVIDEVLFLRDTRYPIYYWTQSRLFAIISVHRLDESESGQMVFQK